MSENKKSLLATFSGYTVINLINALTPFLILPILTKNLTPEDIGIIDLFSSSSIFMTPIIGLCVVQSITTLYFVVERREQYLSTVFSTILSLSFGAILLALIIYFEPGWLPMDEKTKFIILSIVVYVSMNLVVEGFLLLKRNQENVKEFAFIKLSKAFLEIVLVIVLLYFVRDYLVRILSILLATSIVFVIVVIRLFTKTDIKLQIDKSMLKRILLYSLPLIFHTFFASILNYADRYFVAEIVDLKALGKYAVAYQLCMIMSLLINSFNMAWAPYFMKKMSLNPVAFNPSFKKTYKLYGAGLLLFGIVLYFVMPILYTYYVGSSYQVANTVYAFLLLAYFFNGLYRFKVNKLFFYEKTLSIAKLSFIAAVVNIGLNYICINTWGLFGAAFATLISYLALYLLLENELLTLRKDENTASSL